ncbi:hypothetical protein J1P26_24100 [Neobacillus sp. MM2021_6]|uniref:Gmad2 immunoglobulin-like domain-containing protein n=1 Tax=Bacillaceae TaxID=186817 RepID=UPI00140A1B9F|nr:MULTISPECIES: Gmad2 immunoglobulin-like domain-containing protein [Bacillaceae]MBO0962779.1 hypothetical protein [Neobacillus sp. MM2021_6]NHC19217.1 hypothetical protein [Bacillus sp. MM2020_4]
MKKVVNFIMIVAVTVSLVACSQQQEEVKKPNTSENTTSPDKPSVKEPKDTMYHNEVFKDVVATESGEKIIVSGKAQVFEGVFQYALYNGEKVLIENNYQTDGAPAWGEFKITFNKELLSTNEIHFELFVYSAKDGSKVNTLDIPIFGK